MAERLTFSRKAFLDLDRIVEFNDGRNYSTTYSKKIIRGLFKRLNKLVYFPDVGQNTDIENQFILIWTDFYIFYLIENKTIVISRIYHQKENVAP